MDLKKWRHAVTLADEGSFAKASARLHLTQPALTRSIQALEEDIGVSLFDRHYSGVHPTTAGKELIAMARNLLRVANGLRHEADLIRNVKKGNLKFGANTVSARLLAPQAVAEVINGPHNFQIEIVTQPYHLLLELLLEESIEFFISHTSTLQSRQDVTIKPLGKLPFRYYVRPDHPLAGKSKAIDMAVLHQYPLASHILSDFYYNQKRSHVSGLVTWPSHLFSDDLDILKTTASKTNTILLTAEALVAEELSRGALVNLEAKVLGRRQYAELGVVCLANRSLSPLARRVIDAVKEEMTRLPTR